MARIDVERKRRGSAWAWIIGLIILGLIIWALFSWGRWWGGDRVATVPAPTVTTPVETPPLPAANNNNATVGAANAHASAPANAPVNVAPMPAPPTSADNTPIAVVTIIKVPARFLGQPVAGTGKVANVVSDRGFWLEQDGQRMFVMVAKSQGMETASALKPGERVRLSGVVYDNAMASQIAGGIEPDAKAALADQPAFLLVNAANIVQIKDSQSLAAQSDQGAGS